MSSRHHSHNGSSHKGKVAKEEECYYSVLQVERDADEAALRKAYKKLALKYHPDKNQSNKAEAEERFKLVAEAFEVLSDPEKRRVYDTYGRQGLKSGGGSGNGSHDFSFDATDAERLFRSFFGNFHGGAGFFNEDLDSDFDSFFGNDNFGMPSMFSNRRQNNNNSLFSTFGNFSNLDNHFGNSGSFFESSTFSNFGNGFGSSEGSGISKSTKSVTNIVNGKKVTKTETTTRYPNGEVETITEEFDGQNTKRTKTTKSSQNRLESGNQQEHKSRKHKKLGLRF